MQNYTTFTKKFVDFEIARKMKLTESYGNSSSQFVKNISYSMGNCKLFNVTDKIKNLLCLTKTPLKNDEIYLPFPIMFIDVKFTKEELKQMGIKIGYDEIIGIIVQKGYVAFNEEKNDFIGSLSPDLEKNADGFYPVGTNLRISIMSYPEKNSVWFDTFSKNVNINDTFKDMDFKVNEFSKTDKGAREFIHKFVLNFLNFMNDPEVDYVECVANPKQNEKRIKRGKMPIPNNCPIKVDGKLKIYLDSVNERDFTYNYRFWVRGHFKTLRAERYGSNRGKKIWIAPFVKGTGVLVEKDYEVKNEKL